VKLWAEFINKHAVQLLLRLPKISSAYEAYLLLSSLAASGVCLLPERSYSAECAYSGAEESRALFLLTDLFGLLAQTLDSADIDLRHICFNSLWKLADYGEVIFPA
jgi:hypothetical protein